MYKNQLQELAQRSCFNFPSYSCIREGPDHAPRFKATVNFNGETFESPAFCPTLRQAEHAAAEVALSVLANRGPSRALAARVLDETGVYKNLLQETAHRAGLHLPVYTTDRSGTSHVPVFSCIVELAGLRFLGEPAKTKKQAQKNAAMAAWSSLRKLANCSSSSSPSLSNSSESEDIEQDQVIVARALASLRPEESKKSTQTNCQGGQQTTNHNTRDLYLASSSLRPMMYDSCAYPSFSTEIAPYRIWQRTQLLQLQNPQLPVSIPLAPPFRLHFPFLQSPYQHDHLHFAAREQELIPVGHGVQVAAFSPSIYLSDHLISSSVRNRSMVTIQEIQDDKIDKSSELRSSELLNFPICQDHKTEPLAQKLAVVDTKQTCGEPEGKLGESNQLEEKLRGEFDQDAPNTPNFEFQPVQFELRNQYGQSSSLPNVRHHHFSIPNYHGISERPSTVAAPTRIRTVSPVPALISRPQCLANDMSTPPNMRTGGPKFLTRPRSEFGVPSRFMAPPVRIRSVIPVSSAPPAKKIPISSQQDESSVRTNKHNSTEDASTAGSELGKLKI